MKLFIDSANLREVDEALVRGVVCGVTTNPSILAKEPKSDFKTLVKGIIARLKQEPVPLPLSVEVFSTKPEQMIAQACDFVESFDYEPLYVKVPIGWNELKVIHELKKRDIKVNCTGCMAFNQAILAANAGADYISLFYGRIRDTGYDAFTVVEQTASALRHAKSPSQVIVGSIRHIHDINDAVRAGADIVTVPPAFLPVMAGHPKTEEVIQQFVKDFEKWLE